MAHDEKDNTANEPFVGQSDRPEVRLNPDAPISELRVRDLTAILGLGGSRKDFIDGKSWQKDDFDGGIKWWKEGKEIKEHKEWKEKEWKEWKEKPEKLEKREIKELKIEKIEVDGVFEYPERPIPDPRIEQLFEAISGLTSRVSELTNQIEALKKRGQG